MMYFNVNISWLSRIFVSFLPLPNVKRVQCTFVKDEKKSNNSNNINKNKKQKRPNDAKDISKYGVYAQTFSNRIMSSALFCQMISRLSTTSLNFLLFLTK